ncbi:MAG: hypothetical protein KAY27_00435 [Pedobacter sp.]|nr:hypothetical protein [Pedobacter sp.]
MRKVDVYIEVIADSNNYEKLELFNDEEIQINSSIQNVQDLAKVYTDFTQSFTIPASPHNNRLFEHFYQSDVNANDNPNIRRNAFIEIGTIPFRSGKISIESSNVVKGRVESYSITFYGDLTSLKDKFGDDTLKDLDLSSYGMTYNGSAVRTELTTNNVFSHIRFPLISSNRLWSYGDGSNTDISNSSYPIVYNELFPSLRVKKIFETIQTKYNVSFNSNFFNQKLFTELFLLLKNRKSFREVFSVELDFITGTMASNTATYSLANNTMVKVAGQFTIKITHSTVQQCFLDVYLDGKLVNTFTLYTAIGTSGVPYQFPLSNSTGNYTFRLRSNSQLTSASPLIVVLGGGSISTNTYITCANVTTTNYLNPTDHVPDIKIADFLSGIFKMFNLTCYATSVDNFQVEPLDDWYSKGAVVDITKYVDTDEIIIERHKLYKEISFNYEKSESFINKEYDSRFSREFGSVKESFPNYDGEEYKIDVPFENISFTKEDATNTSEPPRAFLLDSVNSVDSYDNKPILLYYNENSVATSFYFNTGVSTAIVNTYKPLTNQLTYNNALYSNHFSVEGSAFDSTSINNSLYLNYYDGYLQNLYNPKNRLTNVKALFPISLLTSLKLNDRLIIRDKRYIINEMKVNLTTGDVDLALINDFRAIANINIPVQSAAGGIIEVPIIVPNGAAETSITFDDPTYTGVTFISTENELLSFIVSANTTGLPISKNFLRDGQPYLTIYQDA